MIEIDHSLQATPLPPEPAQPLLASQLSELEKKQKKRFAGRGERIQTGCREIDDYVLGGGGFERGIMVGISSEEVSEGRLISFHLLASILLSQSSRSLSKNIPLKARAIIIDTTGSFSLFLLANVLKSRILESRALSARRAVETANYEPNAKLVDNGREIGIEEEAERHLELVAINRVFDVEGLWEVLSEVGRDSNSGGSHDELGGKRDDGQVVGDGHANEGAEPGLQPEIIDSEEEDIDLSDPQRTSNQQQLPAATTLHLTKTKSTEQEDSEDEGTEIVIIDNMTNLINELFSRKERNEAHALLSLLSRTIHSLTHNNNILTILHNNTISTKSTYPATSAPRRANKRPSQPQSQSIFASNNQKPALGQVFAQFPDLHILLSPLPKSREDADVLYGQDDDANDARVQYCTIFEVLKDETPNLGSQGEKKFGWREQRWAALEVSKDGLGLVSAFQDTGTMRGMGLSRAYGKRKMEESETGVGTVAKIYGFGGRRV